MTKKKASKAPSKKTSPIVNERERIDPYKKLLARVAGNIAAGILHDPSPGAETADGMATIAVDLAEAILRKIGVEPA